MTAVLSLPPVPVMRRWRFADVHVAGLAADESFVRFHFACELVSMRHASSASADAMIHKPSRLLSDADRTVNLVADYAVLAVHNHPHRHSHLSKPSGESSKIVPVFSVNWRRSCFSTLPAVILLLEENLLAAAARAGHAICQRRATRYSRQLTGSAK